ncbi:hypothetical protein [Candidatus Synchoanobacter obligatus]|uniref:Uncharacterized protein n=1 Tax=Candidatus Synchoanobacter obligatus TaxID=2919597 RepID=A0ABT1L576_9GAMM|nr:hypothetical protein [Candidatus Synchoanobacter obligatus]MCP8352013.1 hypothetical protein [Candidatus Synchoanobacter obligatus]
MLSRGYKTISLLGTLALLAPHSIAKLHIQPKIGFMASMLQLGQSDSQLLPHHAEDSLIFRTYGGETKDGDGKVTNIAPSQGANAAYFPEENALPGSVSKDNQDGASLLQYYAGVQVSYLEENLRPSDSYQFAPVINAYVLVEDGTQANIYSGAYKLDSLTTGGADMGLLITNNGNNLQLGAGGRFYRGEISTGDLFQAMKFVNLDQTGVVYNSVKTLFAKEDNKPYTATITPLFMPYAYVEYSTEVGDVAIAFIKTSYGFESTPEFDDLPDTTTQMFSGDAESFASNSIWQIHSAAVGIQARMFDE